MNKDDRDLSRIIDLLGVEMTRDGKSITNSRWGGLVYHSDRQCNDCDTGKHFMCTYTKIDPNAPEKEYKIILLEEEGNNRFSGKPRTCFVRK